MEKKKKRQNTKTQKHAGVAFSRSLLLHYLDIVFPEIAVACLVRCPYGLHRLGFGDGDQADGGRLERAFGCRGRDAGDDLGQGARDARGGHGESVNIGRDWQRATRWQGVR